MKAILLFIIVSILRVAHVYAQPEVVIRGSRDSLAVKNQVLQYLDNLEVREDIHLQIMFLHKLPNALAGITYQLGTIAPYHYQLFRVYVDNKLSKYEQRLVLAHEMIHVKQYVKGELKVTNKEEVIWKGRKYQYDYSYNRQMPWENEAYKHDNLLMKKCRALPALPLTASGSSHD